MKDISYRCNLCNNKKEVDELVPLNWYGLFGKEKPELCYGRSCEDYHNHLCLSCLKSLKDSLTRLESSDNL